jgi:hypothetical protein
MSADLEPTSITCGYQYRKKFNTLLLWVFILSVFACGQSFLLMTRVVAKKRRNYYITTTSGEVKEVAKQIQ